MVLIPLVYDDAGGDGDGGDGGHLGKVQKLAFSVNCVISTSYRIRSEAVRLMCPQRKREARCSGIRPKKTSCRHGLWAAAVVLSNE